MGLADRPVRRHRRAVPRRRGTGLLLALGLCIAVALEPAKKQFTRAIDWCVLAIAAFELLSLLSSQYRANSARTVSNVLVAAMVYYAVRVTVQTGPAGPTLCGLLALGGGWLAITGLGQFQAHVRELADVGLTDLVAFRSRLMSPPASWVLGEWLTLLQLVFPFACALPAWLWQTGRSRIAVTLALVPAVAIAFTLSLSCSRSIFWSMALYGVLVCALLAIGGIVRLKTAALLLASALASLGLVVAIGSLLYPGILEAYAGRHPSQMRSTEGRIGIWKRSTELVGAHLFWGVGSSNAALALTSTTDQEDTAGFASRTFSLPIQVLAEKGVVVFLLYCGFLALTGREFVLTLRSAVPQERKAMACCYAAGLAAALVRELAYAASGLAVQVPTAATLSGLVIAPAPEEALPHNVKKSPETPAASRVSARSASPTRNTAGFPLKPMTLLVAGVVVVLHFVVGDYDRADEKLRSFYAEMLNASFVAGRQSIDEAIRLWPGNARYYTWRGYVASQKLPFQCPRLQGPLGAVDRQSAMGAIADYRHALELNRWDAVAHHNLAWLEHLLGDDAAAAREWREATLVDPGNAILHLSYAMFLDEAGKVENASLQYETAIELSPAILDSPFFARYRARFPEAAHAIVTRCVAGLEGKLRRAKDPILEARLGKFYQYMGDLGRAGPLLEDAASELPNLPRVWLNLGELREASGDTTGALDCYRKARVIDGGLAGPYLHIGEISMRAGDASVAAQDLRWAVARWGRVNPITAAHNNRLYVGPPQRIDDLLPTTLVWYTTPCEASRAWGGLAELFPKNRTYASRSRTCEALPSPHLRDRVE